MCLQVMILDFDLHHGNGTQAHRQLHVDRGALGMALEAGHAGAEQVGEGAQGQPAGRLALCAAHSSRQHSQPLPVKRTFAMPLQGIALHMQLSTAQALRFARAQGTAI